MIFGIKEENLLKKCTTKNKKEKNEIINILEKIGKLIEKEDFESLKKLYFKITFDNRYKENLRSMKGKTINESAVYNILVNKYYQAKKEKINFEMDISADFKRVNIKPYMLAKVLGILLDNAIEATKICKRKYIYLSFASEKEKDVIKIYNTFNNLIDIDIDKIFIEGYSTKKGNTGLGLWEIKKILEKHTNLELYTEKKEDSFMQTLYICRKKMNIEENHNIFEKQQLSDFNLTNDTIKKIKHDYNNILQAIGGYIIIDDFEGLKQYYEDLLIDCK